MKEHPPTPLPPPPMPPPPSPRQAPHSRKLRPCPPPKYHLSPQYLPLKAGQPQGQLLSKPPIPQPRACLLHFSCLLGVNTVWSRNPEPSLLWTANPVVCCKPKPGTDKTLITLRAGLQGLIMHLMVLELQPDSVFASCASPP